MRRVTGLAAGAVITATGLVTAACMQGGGSATASGNAALTTTPPPSAPATTSSAAPVSGTPGTPADDQAVTAAFVRTTATGSARITTTTAVGNGGRSVPVTATGTIGFANRSADLTETLPGTQGSGETRFVGGVLYEKLPGSLAGRLTHGKPWLSLDVAKLSGQGDGSLQQLVTDSPSDPSSVLNFLRGAGSVSKVGPDTVDGVPTTHYGVVLDLDKAAQGQDATTQQNVRALEGELGSHTLPAQIWLDAQGRLRKLTLHETLSGAPMTQSGSTAKTGPVSFDFTATLSDFGVPVHITAPPASQTADLTGRLSGH
jgi:hypothetical protein